MELKHESITLSSLVRRALNPTCSILICFSREGGGVLAPGFLRSLYRRVQGILRSLLGSLRYGDYGIRTTATDKHTTAHDQNHVTVHFSRVALQLRWGVVELFRVVGTTENILLVFCRLGNSRIWSFLKKVSIRLL